MLEDFPEKRHNTLKINAIEHDLSEWHSKGQEFDSPMLHTMKDSLMAVIFSCGACPSDDGQLSHPPVQGGKGTSEAVDVILNPIRSK